MNPEDKKLIEMLENTAQGIKPNIMFEHELEKRLTAAHKPKRNPFTVLQRNIFPTMGWAAAIAALVLVLNFATRSLLSGTPAAGDGFVCPVTEPNGSLPPGETVESPEYLGNGELWTVLWPNGKVMMEQYNREADGSLSMKWGWVRAVTGPLTIEGHRLDTDASVDAEPLRADIPDGYGDTGFQVSALIFPTTGCWEVTGRVGESSLTFVTEVLFEGVTPTPVTVQEISTPIPSTPITIDGGYEWRGTTLTLVQTLPESPVEANVYSLKISQPAMMDEARALAQQFGMNGEVTETPGEIPGNFDYLLIDGKQKLTVRSDHYFTYYSDFENFTLGKLPGGQALAFMDDFLKQHGFNFGYNIEMTIENEGRQYGILPLTPDGYQMTFDYMMPIRFDVTLDDKSNIIFSGYSINLESLGKFGILTAEEAFQKVLDPNSQPGMMEIFRGNGGGGGGGIGLYKINLTGQRVPMPTPTPQPVIQSGGDGLETIVIQEGDTLEKIASKIGMSVEAIMNINGLSDPNLYVGQSLLIPIMPELSPEKIEGLRGIVSVILYNRADGSQRVEIGFNDPVHSYMILEGNDLQSLQNYQNRPIDIWGTAQRYNENGILVADVDRFEIPFPDLNFQVLKGIEKPTEVEGQTVLVFQSGDGKSYVEFNPNCFDAASPDSIAGSGAIGEEVLIEALVVPDSTFGGYPSVCVSSKAMAIDPKSGKPIEILITADQPYAMDEQSPAPETSAAPTASIEEASLVYYIQNPLLSLNNPNADTQHLQPMWRFYGHYSNGDEFEILVQAVREEFLLPEIIPQIPPG